MKPLTQRISDKIIMLKHILAHIKLSQPDRLRLRAELVECEDDALLLRQYQIEQTTGTTNNNNICKSL